jgi:5-methyltetrahydrofolate--homocysteine methyltransferase
MSVIEELREALERRIVVLDGSMGVTIQRLGLRGCYDQMSITHADVIENIHKEFLDAGADIVETNSFTATSIALADFGLERETRAINLAAAGSARRAVDAAIAADGRRRWVAGSMGPTTKTGSISPDVNDPGARAVTFRELVVAFKEQALALLEGGVDLLLPETHIDTLNAKAALYAIEEAFDEGARRVPILCSVTIPDKSGRTLSGQTIEAFYRSIEHHDLLAVGINCALGADDMRPHVQELARIARVPVVCYPNAGLPNEFGEYDDTPEHMAKVLGSFAREGWLNMVGGCCGTTATHVAQIKAAVEGVGPRRPPALNQPLDLFRHQAV